MANLYDILSRHYEVLFPVPDARALALAGFLSRQDGAHVLDAGCATGELCRRLAALGCLATGLDHNAVMVEEAQWRAFGSGMSPGNPVFHIADLLDSSAFAAPGSLDGVYCLGNTLPHLSPEQAIQGLQGFRTLLGENGVLVLGMVHFEPVLHGGVKEFPVLEAGGVAFHRTYTAMATGQVRFDAVLETERSLSEDLEDEGAWPETVWKSGAQEILWGYGRDQVRGMLEDSGFRRVELFADASRKPVSVQDGGTVFVARP